MLHTKHKHFILKCCISVCIRRVLDTITCMMLDDIYETFLSVLDCMILNIACQNHINFQNFLMIMYWPSMSYVQLKKTQQSILTIEPNCLVNKVLNFGINIGIKKRFMILEVDNIGIDNIMYILYRTPQNPTQCLILIEISRILKRCF